MAKKKRKRRKKTMDSAKCSHTVKEKEKRQVAGEIRRNETRRRGSNRVCASPDQTLGIVRIKNIKSKKQEAKKKERLSSWVWNGMEKANGATKRKEWHTQLRVCLLNAFASTGSGVKTRGDGAHPAWLPPSSPLHRSHRSHTFQTKRWKKEEHPASYSECSSSPFSPLCSAYFCSSLLIIFFFLCEKWTKRQSASSDLIVIRKSQHLATTPVAAKYKPTVGRADDRYHRRFCSCHNLFPPIPGNNSPFRLAKMPLGLFALAIIMQPTRFCEQKKRLVHIKGTQMVTLITGENRSLVFVVKETGNFGQCCNIHS